MNIHHCNKPIDVYLIYSPYLCNKIVENTKKYAKDSQIKKWPSSEYKNKKFHTFSVLYETN